MKLKEKNKVIFILSMGHSGSTLLDIILGSLDGIFSTGELIWFPFQVERERDKNETISKQNQNICTCGDSFTDCKVWSGVLNLIEKQYNLDIIKSTDFPISTHDNTKLLREKNISIFKRITNNLQEYFNTRHPFYKTISYYRNMKYERDKLNYKELIDSIIKVTNSEYVVDSSKDISRAITLSTEKSIIPHYIILYRDLRRVVSSYIKHGGNPYIAIVKYYIYYSNIYKFFKKNKDLNLLLVKYEDFCKDVPRLKKDIGKFLSIDISSLNKDEYLMKNYHLVGGNPMRYSDKIIIRQDNNWENNIENKKLLYIIEKMEKRYINLFNKISKLSRS